jgi:hypothetical protein
MEDSAVLELDVTRIALTTDSFVIDPIFFGNGDIGKIAVCGTVNDLAVSGATPRYITLSLVLEEGFPIADLERVLDSVREAADQARVEVVAGDTKVVRGGEVDKLFINTAGIGEFAREIELGMSRVTPGDAVIVTGWLGNHSIHILSLREGLGFEERVLSDCAPLDGLVWNVLEDQARGVHCMRDITAGPGDGPTRSPTGRGLDADRAVRAADPARDRDGGRHAGGRSDVPGQRGQHLHVRRRGRRRGHPGVGALASVRPPGPDRGHGGGAQRERGHAGTGRRDRDDRRAAVRSRAAEAVLMASNFGKCLTIVYQ